jgi:hypothetical protein
MAVEIEETHEGRFVQFNSLRGGDFLQRVVNVRQVIRRHVAHEGARNFVIAHAAVQPVQKEDELRHDRDERGQNAVPMCGHGRPPGSKGSRGGKGLRPANFGSQLCKNCSKAVGNGNFGNRFEEALGRLREER